MESTIVNKIGSKIPATAKEFMNDLPLIPLPFFGLIAMTPLQLEIALCNFALNRLKAL